jgi:hypothetical protein
MIVPFVQLLGEHFDMNVNDKVFKDNKCRMKTVDGITFVISKKGNMLEVKVLNIAEICEYIGYNPNDKHKVFLGNYLKMNGFDMTNYMVDGNLKKAYRFMLKNEHNIK